MRHALLIGPFGGAISIGNDGGVNSTAVLRSCTLSSNEARKVRRHANQEQCVIDMCML